MATMSQTWSIFTAFTLLVMQLCAGKKSCSIWSSAGPVVQRGSSFTIYCTFNCKCKGSMYSDHPPTLQSHKELNSTTIYFNVVNITKNRTYSCKCNCSPALDPCGLDISAGYLPDPPKNISCICKLKNKESGVVSCTWNRGRDTYLSNNSMLWVRTVPGKHKEDGLHSNRTDRPSVSFSVSRSVQLISVWAQTGNRLGYAASSPINFTLSDIVMPSTPVLHQPNCFSRGCSMKVKQSVETQHLEIQYKTGEQTWTAYRDQGVQDLSISPLEPYRLYHFRARSKFSNGLWSEWSTSISSWTQEEAPVKELDVWYAEAASDFTSLRVYWKEANISISRGKIIEYKLRIYNPDSGSENVTNISGNARNYSVPFCANCDVTVWARNSKGISPPARVTTRYMEAKPPLGVRVKADNDNVTISWRMPETAALPTAYVLEWYPEGHKLEELKWIRLGRNDTQFVITGIKRFKCYVGAVYVYYSESSVNRTTFTGVATMESAPGAGPLVQEKPEGNKVKVTWMELPRDQRGGCIIKYTIYLKSNSGSLQPYSIPASERTYTIHDLSPGFYSLWMTASTAKGEGPAGQTVKFFIQQETQLSFLLLCGIISLIVLFLFCLCQSSTVKQRFWVLFQCIMLDVVPDPANSKWAKECTREKGKINLQLQLSNPSVTEDEREPVLVDVEELPKQNIDTSTPTNVSPQHIPQTDLSSEGSPATLLYPMTTYIKSFSQDSDSSNHTHTSEDTNTSADYISSHGPGIMSEEEQENEEFAEMLVFFPSHNIFIEPLAFGGKLTLDAVKINCSDSDHNSLVRCNLSENNF
ncbi:interleukin-12 receptor subunit beta-2 [Mastacembelus armatus]|uniref:Interleukin 12 receptor, beta 2a n=1 Tax=Mastacembelus armatus TaxID=205130 RepID=A0A3Q3MW95_9TELE|nr:interleukin-12 receptor subunit beta-2-like [Mastacembelus armatus]